MIRKRIPITGWIPNYTVGTFLQDLLAGFSVGLTEIPQGIAYAVVAGNHENNLKKLIESRLRNMLVTRKNIGRVTKLFGCGSVFKVIVNFLYS